ncbi:hypothetical protein RDI58_022136 [Solanum bulbocastanum]|uniref:Uncharacterized protein n=1 Tax=Solanum bulbocastanum TaxID=147425 RepID=A0AAN8Y5I3_SOLBU
MCSVVCFSNVVIAHLQHARLIDHNVLETLFIPSPRETVLLHKRLIKDSVINFLFQLLLLQLLLILVRRHRSLKVSFKYSTFFLFYNVELQENGVKFITISRIKGNNELT